MLLLRPPMQWLASGSFYRTLWIPILARRGHCPPRTPSLPWKPAFSSSVPRLSTLDPPRLYAPLPLSSSPAPSSSHTPPLPPIAMVSSLLLLSTAIPSTPSPTPVLGQPRLLLGCLHCHHLRLSVVAGCITSHGLLA